MKRVSNQAKATPSPSSPIQVQPNERISISAGTFTQLITLAENSVHTLPFATVAGIIDKAQRDVKVIGTKPAKD